MAHIEKSWLPLRCIVLVSNSRNNEEHTVIVPRTATQVHAKDALQILDYQLFAFIPVRLT
ncbi:MAG TPA: hypothetical protein VEL11_11480 [Candidatus Bathyarchaeia archaeon]|nr:hypothetical protein [Candidatus Bathyarchaeia archaeon]